jgi:hypothetical protein
MTLVCLMDVAADLADELELREAEADSLLDELLQTSSSPGDATAPEEETVHEGTP